MDSGGVGFLRRFEETSYCRRTGCDSDELEVNAEASLHPLPVTG